MSFTFLFFCASVAIVRQSQSVQNPSFQPHHHHVLLIPLIEELDCKAGQELFDLPAVALAAFNAGGSDACSDAFNGGQPCGGADRRPGAKRPPSPFEFIDLGN